jgi:glycosyltransferase involved in cell wall biosynthesis
MPAERIHVLRNGVDSVMFAPFNRAEARTRLGLRNDCRWVLGVGNLVVEKGFELLIRAVAMLDDTRLLIVGEGPLRNALASRARDLAPGRVEFRANMSQSDLRYAYAAGDVLALASLREGWPNVVLEAIACGTPVVAAAVGGVPEILGGADAPARLVNGRDAAQWRDALRNILNASLPPDVVRGYAHRFAWDEVVEQQCVLYERVARGRLHFGDANRSVSTCG